MADGKGKLSYDEFVNIRPTSENNTTAIEFLISGTVTPVSGSNNWWNGNQYEIVGINIPYRTFAENGSIQDNRITLANLRRISLPGILEGTMLVLTVLDRTLKTDYASFKVTSKLISASVFETASLSSIDDINPFWWDTSSIHFDYDCSKELGSCVVGFEPNTPIRVFVDEYDAVLGSVQELRGSKFLTPVRTDLPDRGLIDRRVITGSVADSYFADSGIFAGHFCGSKYVGQYHQKEIPGFTSGSFVNRSKELLDEGSRRDPAFLVLTGFSGSIIRDEFINKDIEAGTTNFEELKFSRYRVSGSLERTILDEPLENIPDEARRAVHQSKSLQYFELFQTGSANILDFGPNFDPEQWVTGSLTLPEKYDIIYKQVQSGSSYYRVVDSIFYNAEANILYETDLYGRVIDMRRLDTGSVEEEEEEEPIEQ